LGASLLLDQFNNFVTGSASLVLKYGSFGKEVGQINIQKPKAKLKRLEENSKLLFKRGLNSF